MRNETEEEEKIKNDCRFCYVHKTSNFKLAAL